MNDYLKVVTETPIEVLCTVAISAFGKKLVRQKQPPPSPPSIMQPIMINLYGAHDAEQVHKLIQMVRDDIAAGDVEVRDVA